MQRAMLLELLQLGDIEPDTNSKRLQLHRFLAALVPGILLTQGNNHAYTSYSEEC